MKKYLVGLFALVCGLVVCNDVSATNRLFQRNVQRVVVKEQVQVQKIQVQKVVKQQVVVQEVQRVQKVVVQPVYAVQVQPVQAYYQAPLVQQFNAGYQCGSSSNLQLRQEVEALRLELQRQQLRQQLQTPPK